MKQFIRFLLLGLPLYTSAQKDTCNITVKMNKSEQVPSKAYLVYSLGWTNQHILDSADYKDNGFTFQQFISNPTEVSLVINYDEEKRNLDIVKSDNLKFYLEKGIIDIVSKDSIKNAIAKGGEINEEYQVYKKEVDDENLKAYKSLQAYFLKFSDSAKKSKEVQKELMEKVRLVAGKTDSMKRVFINNHPDYYISAVILNELAGKNTDYTKINPLYERLTPELKNSDIGKSILKKLNMVSFLLPGSQALNFTLNDTNSIVRSLSDFKGKYILLDFWASWCGPCRAENPNVVKAYQRYKNKNFTIIGISLDNNKEAWLNAIHKDGLYWNQLSDLKGWKNSVAQLYKIQSIPQNVFIDPTGKVIAKNLRGEDLQKILAEHLK